MNVKIKLKAAMVVFCTVSLIAPITASATDVWCTYYIDAVKNVKETKKMSEQACKDKHGKASTKPPVIK